MFFGWLHNTQSDITHWYLSLCPLSPFFSLYPPILRTKSPPAHPYYDSNYSQKVQNHIRICLAPFAGVYRFCSVFPCQLWRTPVIISPGENEMTCFHQPKPNLINNSVEPDNPWKCVWVVLVMINALLWCTETGHLLIVTSLAVACPSPPLSLSPFFKYLLALFLSLSCFVLHDLIW